MSQTIASLALFAILLAASQRDLLARIDRDGKGTEREEPEAPAPKGIYVRGYYRNAA